jgi:hypothetical protein
MFGARGCNKIAVKRQEKRLAADGKAGISGQDKRSKLPPLGSVELERLLEEADGSIKGGNLFDGRKTLLEVWRRLPAGVAKDKVEMRLGEINVDLVCSKRNMPGKIDYTIQSGDSLQLIAKRHGVTSELIVKSNDIADSNRIIAGRRLRFLEWPNFRIEVSKKNNTLLLTLDDTFFKRYAVGAGKEGETPLGTFSIQRKTERPSWWLPDGREIPYGDPKNILGSRWMALVATGSTPPLTGYGIHGTWDNTGIGRASSQGCIRMRNSDVEELFMLVVEGTPVVIRD